MSKHPTFKLFDLPLRHLHRKLLRLIDQQTYNLYFVYIAAPQRLRQGMITSYDLRDLAQLR